MPATRRQWLTATSLLGIALPAAHAQPRSDMSSSEEQGEMQVGAGTQSGVTSVSFALVLLGVATSGVATAQQDRAAAARPPATAATCAACHGATGEGNAAGGFPRLAGLPSAYMQRQLDAFADGQRRSAVMAPVAKALAAADRQALSRYYASLPPPAAAAPASAPAPQAQAIGLALATQGRWSDHLPACDQCHAPGGRGVGEDFPPLAGQPAAYLADQLRAWKSAARPPGPMALMATIAGKLSAADIDSVTGHYAALPPAPRRPAR